MSVLAGPDGADGKRGLCERTKPYTAGTAKRNLKASKDLAPLGFSGVVLRQFELFSVGAHLMMCGFLKGMWVAVTSLTC